MLKLLVARVALRLVQHSRRPIGFAVVYHAVGPRTGDPTRELVPPHGRGLFAAQVRFLARRFRPVRASELLDAVRDRARGERIPVAVTFDDDLASHLLEVLPVLMRSRVPGTFFLAGPTRPEAPPWWSALQLAFDAGQLPSGDADVHALAQAVETLPAEQRDRESERLASVPVDGGHPAPMAAGDSRALIAAGSEVGFHTVGHYALTTLDAETLAREVREGRAELAGEAAQPVTSFAYPHGKNDSAARDAVDAAGYEVAFTTSPQCVTADSDPLRVGRIEPSFDSAEAFELEVFRLFRGALRSRP